MGKLFWLRTVLAALGLFCLNAYVCRELFTVETTAHMNAMHGFWIAMAKHAQSWWMPSWWPWWDCGTPMEFTYAPVFPGSMALLSSVAHISAQRAFHIVAGLVYCLGPVTLFLMLAGLTRSVSWSFAAGVLYSLFSVSNAVVPDQTWSTERLQWPRRLFLLATWDDAPHLMGLLLVPLVILFWVRALERRRWPDILATILLMALSMAASAFGVTNLMIAGCAILFTARRKYWISTVTLTTAMGATAYLLVSPWMPPTLLSAIRFNARYHEGNFGLFPSLTAIGIIALGWAILSGPVHRWAQDRRLELLTLLAWITMMIPVLAQYVNRAVFPQPGRYKFEFELMFAAFLPFAVRHAFQRWPLGVKSAAVLLLLALAGEQVVVHRRLAKDVLRSRDITQTIEYRTARWAEQNAGEARVALPGSLGQWANTFTSVQQFAGGSYSTTSNPVQQTAWKSVIWGPSPEDARNAASLLTAYGTGILVIPGRNSPEFWKPITNPERFEALYEPIWKESDTTAFRIAPGRGTLVHSVPPESLVPPAGRGRFAIDKVRAFASHLSTTDPEASFVWTSPNTASARVTAAPNQVVHIQVNHHPGWTATANGRPVVLKADGLGLMYFEPPSSGSVAIELAFNGSAEQWICRVASLLTLLALLVITFQEWRKQRVDAARA